MQIIFKRVSIKNFISIGKEPVVVDFRPGMHVITGVNLDRGMRANGSGKSTICDSINFAIFGNTIKDLNKEFIVNNITRYNCEVELDFVGVVNSKVTEYKIIRGLEPSHCEFFINGEDKTRDSIVNTTELILQTLHTSQEIFENCVLLSINGTTPFMAKKKTEKRKFIESIFNLEIFSDMLKILKEDYNEKNRTFDITNGKYDEVQKSLTTFKQQQTKYLTDNKNRIESLLAKKSNNITEIQKIESKLAATNSEFNIEEAKKKLTELQNNNELCDQGIKVAEKNINQILPQLDFKKKELKNIGTDKDTCPTCLKPITQADVEHINSRKLNLLQEIAELKEKDEKNQKQLDDLQNLKKKLKSGISKLLEDVNQFNIRDQTTKNNNERKSQLQNLNEEIDKELEVVKTQILEVRDNSKELTERLKEIEEYLEKLKKELAIIDTSRFIISEEGVKSTIVKRMLQLFNSKIAYYLKLLDSNAICVFNEYFEEEIINEKGVVCSYFNFSGAERKNIDFACLFAFMDLRRMQSGNSFNLSIYDELFDSSLDSKGLELVMNILKERIEKYSECIVIISHRKEAIKSISGDGDVIFLQKQNGITTRVEYKE